MLDDKPNHIRTDLSDGVLTVAIDRPEKKNALTQAMYEGLTAALEQAQSDPEVRAVILTGAGGQFTAGNDLADFVGAGPQKGPAAALALLHRAATLDVPLIAAVEGVAIGIGTTILLHCDIAVASSDARFKTPFIDLGLCPEGASSLLMPRMLGRSASVRFLMLGETVPAEEARAWGLLDALDPDPLARARALAAEIASKPGEAMRATKRLMREAAGGAVVETIDREARAFAERLASPEAQAAFRAFFMKAAQKP
ncbi:MAG: enoyl-CoA hydratase-related protein [Pseudomonadota bacterium]